MKNVLFHAGSNRIQVSGAYPNFEDLSFPDLEKNISFMAFEIGRSIRNYEKMQMKTLEREFFAIELLTTQQKHFSALVPQTKLNKFLNRYSTCLPFQKNNVPSSRYINASFISGAKLPEQSQMFIATQAPLTYSIPEFWHMVFTQNCSSIFTLCGIEDCKKGACEVYWPLSNNKSVHGEYSIETIKECEKNGYVQRDLQISTSKEIKSIKHFQYLNWPDKKIPSDQESFLQLLNELKEAEKNVTEKIIVHCSAGVGRTGTMLALSNLKTIIDEQFERKLDYGVSVFSVVRRLREQRMQMVQTIEQYDFIHSIVEKWTEDWETKIKPSDQSTKDAQV